MKARKLFKSRFVIIYICIIYVGTAISFHIAGAGMKSLAF
jgi:hypothetical protein